MIGLPLCDLEVHHLFYVPEYGPPVVQVLLFQLVLRFRVHFIPTPSCIRNVQIERWEPDTCAFTSQTLTHTHTQAWPERSTSDTGRVLQGQFWARDGHPCDPCTWKAMCERLSLPSSSSSQTHRPPCLHAGDSGHLASTFHLRRKLAHGLRDVVCVFECIGTWNGGLLKLGLIAGCLPELPPRPLSGQVGGVPRDGRPETARGRGIGPHRCEGPHRGEAGRDGAKNFVTGCALHSQVRHGAWCGIYGSGASPACIFKHTSVPVWVDGRIGDRGRGAEVDEGFPPWSQRRCIGIRGNRGRAIIVVGIHLVALCDLGEQLIQILELRLSCHLLSTCGPTMHQKFVGWACPSCRLPLSRWALGNHLGAAPVFLSLPVQESVLDCCSTCTDPR